MVREEKKQRVGKEKGFSFSTAEKKYNAEGYDFHTRGFFDRKINESSRVDYF